MSIPQKFNAYQRNPNLFFVVAARARERMLAVPAARREIARGRQSIRRQLAFHILRPGGRA